MEIVETSLDSHSLYTTSNTNLSDIFIHFILERKVVRNNCLYHYRSI